MFQYQVTFESPWYLLLMLLVPVLWWFSFHSLAALGSVRRILALLLRTVILVLVIAALAEIQLVRTSDRLTVIYLLDQSLSIPPDRRKAIVDYVNRAIVEHREGEDRAGVIVFGREAAIEIPPFDDAVQLRSIESPLDPEYTNLAGAMKLAQASFPEDSAKRIVVVSDGNENVGDAVQQAQGLAGAGIGIDVVPVRYRTRTDVAVERVSIPSDVRRGQPFDLKVVISNSAPPTTNDSGGVRGRLVVSQLAGNQPRVIAEQWVTLPPGKKVFSVPQRIDEPAFYQYEARFIPERPGDDAMAQNNRGTTFTHIRGKGQVLLIVEDEKSRGEYERLIKALRSENLEVTVQPAGQLFSSLAELQPFDAVILGNVSRESFTDAHVKMLVSNTQQMGAGLVMLGGPNSFGAGGWTDTDLEKAMPIDFQIKAAKVVPRGALAMLMHASEIPQGNYWQKVVAKEALKALGPRDYCGVIHWSGNEQWLWAGGLAEVGKNRDKMLARLDRMMPGDMPAFDPAMVMAQKAFADPNLDAPVKHMIVISDGDPSRPSAAVVKALVRLKVTVSTVAVGAHGPAESKVLLDLANDTGGKPYVVNNPKALPKIFQREARRVARQLIKESDRGIVPRVKIEGHEMMGRIAGDLPPINGFVLTSRKSSGSGSLAEIVLVSPEPPGEDNNTLLAGWTYGLGKTVAYTSDATTRWNRHWTDWANYDKFFGQMIRWSMRPVGDDQNFTVATDCQDGKVRVVVTALDKSDEFLNFLEMAARVSGPDLDNPPSLKLQQTAPGRYEGSFPAQDSGSYFVTISPGPGKPLVSAGINVPYSDEFRDRAANEALLGQLARQVPQGGAAGLVIEARDDSDDVRPLVEINSFRHDLPKATSSQDAWYYLVMVGSCLFFFDVFVRRVQVSFAWVPVMAGRVRNFVLRREPQVAPSEYMERLRSRKAEVSGQIEQMREGTRFEAPSTAPVDAQVLDEAAGGHAPARPGPAAAAPPMTPEQKAEEETYTSRLLKAKKRVWEERKKE
jgi:uncharacterized membrane protein